MARPPRHNVDYFPHYISDGKKMFIIEAKYGNDGYAVWFKLLESLAKSDDHWIDLSDTANMMYLCAKCRVSTEVLTSVLSDLCDLGEIDSELWKSERVVWSDKFILSVKDAYDKRSNSCPNRDTVIHKLRGLGRCKPPKGRSKGAVNPQTIVNNTIENETESDAPPTEHSLVTWIKKHTPRVNQMKKPLTNDEAERLIADLDIGKNERGEMLRGILMSMENYVPLLNKSVSANLTIRKWWKMEEERKASGKPKQAEETFVPRTEIYYK
jgi:hypothetical protein